MAEKEDSARVSSAPAPSRPTITLPPRPSMETFFTGGSGASPGPMTLVSSFFSDNYPDSGCRSFSQLLAGAMASPLARPSFYTDNSTGNSTKEPGPDSVSGFKQSRPMNLVVSRSPLFTIPPGLSPSGLLNSPGFFSPLSPFGMSHQQALAQVTAQAALAQSQMLSEYHQPSSVADLTESLTHNPSFTLGEASQMQMAPSTSDPRSSMMESSEASHPDMKYQPASIAIDKPADDGYNWRKYGQKQVKGSEYPRSYYKCTHLNCPVKKKVERSPDGQVTEIIYKGQHNHELPQPNRRAKEGSDLNVNIQAKPDLCPQSRAGNQNKSSETVPAYSVPQGDQESTGAGPPKLPGSSDSEEEGDLEARGEGDLDEPNPKRRITDTGASEVTLRHKTVTEPKIIVQTRSEVDLLDDGYRWRKYGQKVVKGNPHPRSYYKCTNPGCNVRKHVERASTDPKAVITTYEGKHNHDIPAARNSSHNTADRIAPQKVVAEKQSLLKETGFGNNDKRPVLLQLKEEQIRV
ncbi:probable WRKY transcription factor 3 isoform X2 [Juglans microcarpa x Juglans regia]|uniref:probable WRKY transcription factor 3 isoform X2 n=1 Tax=Juglans microcarpa x Juglans regia TaxID=2249226 RepID=UPI001B7ED5CF|nr:probable WRKY transcription factor 3 isoform X2 [Juglans microcarpa x Juglans regia]